MRAAYFTVSRRLGREQPAIWWDELPRMPIRDLVYVIRLDQFPNADQLVTASLDQLYAVFCALRKKGKLPPRWEPPPPVTSGQKPVVRIGHREHHPRRHLPDLP